MNTRSLILAFVLATSQSLGSETPLTTDRPDQSDSPITVPIGLFQVEAGAQYGERSCCGEELASYAAPQLLLRYGLTDSLELRLSAPGYTSVRTETENGSVRDRGLADTAIGVKIKLASHAGNVPDIAFVGALNLPTGDDEISSERVDPGFRLAAAYPLGSRVTLGSNVGMFWLTSRDSAGGLDTRSFFEWTAVAGFAISDKLSGFTEVFGTAGVSAEDRSTTSFGAGVACLLGPRTQIDFRATAGLSREAQDWTLGAGVSYRFPR